MSAENGGVSPVISYEKCAAVVLDVAGTTTAIQFVKDTLFKYATDNVEQFLKDKWEDESVKAAVKDLKDSELDQAAAAALVKELTEKNDENKALKVLQGMIYETGYTSGAIKAPVFEDVPGCVESWAKSRKVAIYSTGSVEAQKLLFAHTTEGDLTAHITRYFDQSVVGLKTEKESYVKVAKELEVEPETVLFVSDNVDEVKAAKAAGMLVAVIERPGNAALADDVKSELTVIASFKDVSFENPAKRKIDDEPATAEEPPTKVAKTEADDKTEKEATAVETPAEAVETMEVDAATDRKDPEHKTEETPAEKTESESTETTAMDTAEETKEETATEKDGAKPEETKTETDSVVDKPAEDEKKEVVAAKEDKEKAEDKPAAEETTGKTEDVAVVEGENEVDNKTVAAEKKPEEDKAAEEPAVEKAEEAKAEPAVEVAVEAKETEEKPESNGAVENGKHEDEKENNAELANGIENGKSENGTEEKEKGEEATKTDDSEIKVKKLDEPVESTPVAVEV